MTRLAPLAPTGAIGPDGADGPRRPCWRRWRCRPHGPDRAAWCRWRAGARSRRSRRWPEQRHRDTGTTAGFDGNDGLGATVTATATCTTGTLVSGGGNVTDNNAGKHYAAITSSYPSSDGDTWTVVATIVAGNHANGNPPSLRPTPSAARSSTTHLVTSEPRLETAGVPHVTDTFVADGPSQTAQTAAPVQSADARPSGAPPGPRPAPVLLLPGAQRGGQPRGPGE